MDETASFLAEWETKQRNLRKTIDDLHAFYHSTRDTLLTGIESIRTREQQLKERESKSEELDYIEEAIIEKNLEIEEAKTRLTSLESRIHTAEARISELEELIKTGVDQLRDVEIKLVERVDAYDLVSESWLEENKVSGCFDANVEEDLKAGNMLNDVSRRERELEQKSIEFEVRCKKRENELFALQKKVAEGEDELRKKRLLLEAKEHGLKQKQCGCGARSDGLKSSPRVNSSAASPSGVKGIVFNSCIGVNIARSDGREGTPRVNSYAASPSGVKGIKINSSLVKTEEPESLPATRDEMNVPGFLNQNSSGKKFSMSDLVASLFAIKYPAQLLLSRMKNSLFDERNMLKNTFLLMIVSAKIESHLRADANCLAVQWKKKLRNNPGNPFENLGFLLYIATCGLDSILNVDEVVRILELISQRKQALEYFFELKKSLELCQASFADKMADIIRDLSERMQLPRAITIRFGCVFKLIDSPVLSPLLKEYVDDSTECFNAVLRIAADEREKNIADLRVVIECLREYHLETGHCSKTIETHIVSLEALKERYGKVIESCTDSNIEQRVLRKRKEPIPSTCPVQSSRLKKK